MNFLLYFVSYNIFMFPWETIYQIMQLYNLMMNESFSMFSTFDCSSKSLYSWEFMVYLEYFTYNEKVSNSMMKMFFVLCLLMCMMSYLSIDPMKSSFFLILSLLLTVPLMSFSNHIWFSYFICLLFLSGIFVILVYFSSLSSLSYTKNYFWFLVFVFSLIYFSLDYVFYYQFVGMSSFYFSIYWFIFIFILFSLVFFMNFSSYYLSFSGALRKI